MYAGHFAAALALKARQPRAPTWALLVGVALLDLLFGLFVPLGIERVTPTPGVPPGFRLDFIDWSHSLAAALFWSLLYALCFARRGWAVAYILGVSVFSHFLLDWPMHPGDLALWPGSAAHVGLDRKSTRLNSSHGSISYAVFCLKKKQLIFGLACGCVAIFRGGAMLELKQLRQ